MHGCQSEENQEYFLERFLMHGHLPHCIGNEVYKYSLAGDQLWFEDPRGHWFTSLPSSPGACQAAHQKCFVDVAGRRQRSCLAEIQVIPTPSLPFRSLRKCHILPLFVPDTQGREELGIQLHLLSNVYSSWASFTNLEMEGTVWA